MSDDAVEIVRLRNHFYRDNYRRLALALLITLLIVIILVGTLFYVLTHPPKPVYFATTADGRLVKLQPLTDPVLSDSAIAQWATKVAMQAYSYNYVDYRDALTRLSDNFTPYGWKQFVAGLQASNNLKAIIDRHFIMSAVATGSPQILQQGLLGDHYGWQVSLPMLVLLHSGSGQQIQQAYDVTLLVVRESRLNYPDGVAVAQFVASQREGMPSA
ncbi:MAG: type IVB secretion system apparatus protein IcmL/DotI [Legionellales bacterium]|nr:type IVB secretion system apparatus protein IcmL/DotI [Legionellales bacterium]